jgi:FlaA1/EpsC-like NDP-sugar epimerase
LIDDDTAKHGRDLNGVKVFGGIDDIATIAEHLGTRVVILAIPEESASIRRRAIEKANEVGLTVMTVPAIGDLLSGKVTISEIRQVELEDLLGREAVSLDEHGLNGLLTDRSVLITGAGGSIGSELCRQVAKFNPRILVLAELSEYALYQIEQEFCRDFPGVPIACLVGDVRDERRMREILSRFSPEVVIHAAAYKHVPLMERGNVWEVLRNNVLGTLVMARLSANMGVEKFVFVSTDKAVNPTSVMGVSKRLAELTCQAVQHEAQTSFVLVRFGNVLGSTGSVIPKFREQIAAGGPVTVTHPEITRFFMTIPEAAQLVLQAGLMGDHGEIFVLDMGDPVRIADLARDMIRLSGFNEEDIGIVYTGLRPGEKLYEELLADVESTLPTRHAKLRIAKSGARLPTQWIGALESWLSAEPMGDETAIRAQLREWVPEYSYEAAVSSL